MTTGFDEQFAAARQQPSYWSYRACLDFIDRIVGEMDTQGVTRAELARRMGTSRAWVSRVLAGESNLTMASAGKLAFALGMRVTMGLEPVDPAAVRLEGGQPPGRPRSA